MVWRDNVIRTEAYCRIFGASVATQSLFKLKTLVVSLKHLGFSRNRPYGIQEMWAYFIRDLLHDVFFKSRRRAHGTGFMTMLIAI